MQNVFKSYWKQLKDYAFFREFLNANLYVVSSFLVSQSC